MCGWNEARGGVHRRRRKQVPRHRRRAAIELSVLLDERPQAEAASIVPWHRSCTVVLMMKAPVCFSLALACTLATSCDAPSSDSELSAEAHFVVGVVTDNDNPRAKVTATLDDATGAPACLRLVDDVAATADGEALEVEVSEVLNVDKGGPRASCDILSATGSIDLDDSGSTFAVRNVGDEVAMKVSSLVPAGIEPVGTLDDLSEGDRVEFEALGALDGQCVSIAFVNDAGERSRTYGPCLAFEGDVVVTGSTFAMSVPDDAPSGDIDIVVSVPRAIPIDRCDFASCTVQVTEVWDLPGNVVR